MRLRRGTAIRRHDTGARLAGVLLLTLAACSRGAVSRGVLHLVPEGVVEEPLIAGKVSRMGFESTVGTEHRVTIAVPANDPMLLIAYALPSDGKRNPMPEVRFHAALSGRPDGPTTVLDTSGTDRWREAAIDLGPCAGQRLELVLRAKATAVDANRKVYWATPTVVRSAPDRPNVLLICIDSLRADHLGCYGYHRNTSPTIDSLAFRGCRFERAIAQSSWTLPSLASLLTSLYAKSHGVGSARHALNPNVQTLAELLREAGYVTAAIISGGPILPVNGLAQGFDLYDSGCHGTGASGDVRNPCTHRHAIRWLGEHGRSPFFLFVHYWDVHFDYAPPPPYDALFDSTYAGPVDGAIAQHGGHLPAGLPPRDAQHLVALYDGEIAHTDAYTDRLLSELRRLEIQGRTVVIVTSDHGDEFFEHGTTGHAHTLFQELIHVPLIWADPRWADGPRVVTELVELVDVAPTILELLDLEPVGAMQGSSFLNLIRGTGSSHSPAFSELAADLKAVLLGEGKLIHRTLSGSTKGFNLASDTHEARPLPARRVPNGPALKESLSSFLRPAKRTALELRVSGGNLEGDATIELSGPDIVGAEAHGLEQTDSLSIAPNGKKAILKSSAPPGDVDGLTVELLSPHSAVMIAAARGGRPLAPRRITLGAGQHPQPTEGVPFKIRADDPRLRPPPSARLKHVPTGDIEVRIWASGAGGADPLSVELQPEVEEELRALGYLR